MKLTLGLGSPLALGELAWMSTYIVDALLIGRMPHSAISISASSLGNTIYYALVFCIIRGLDGVEALVAQAYGRNDRESCLRTLAQSFWFVILGTPLVMLATVAALHLLSSFGISHEIVSETSGYLHALIWSTAPLLLYMTLRRYLQSTNRVLLVAVSLLIAVPVNFVCDWAFIFGRFSFPSLGIAGSGWATCVVRLAMLSLLVYGVMQSLRDDGLQLNIKLLLPDFGRLRLLVRIGWPSAIGNVTDLGFSTWMSIVCARLGTTQLAAHQVVLDLDAFVYMVPLGLSYATVARVGQSAGQCSFLAIRRSARASLILGAIFITIASTLFAGFPHRWASIYTNDPAVVAIAAPIFLICGLLQFGDASGVILSSALTGLGDTRTPFLVNTTVYWLIGAPLSVALGFHTSLGLRGLWMGRALAALLTALILSLIWRIRLRQMEGQSTAFPLTLLRPLRIR